MKNGYIKIRGAKQNNLKGININIPYNHLLVITGMSGSGKSSLALDILHAEGQRRYVETFSPYARQFMERMDSPNVDRIENIPPAIAIDQKEPIRTSRSTVGTMTGITDYAKLLFARIGILHCEKCGRSIIPSDPPAVWHTIKDTKHGEELIITFPFELKKEDMEKSINYLMSHGFTRFLMAWEICELDGIDKSDKEIIDVISDRLLFKPSHQKRIIDSIEQAFHMGDGRLNIWLRSEKLMLSFSRRLECPYCKINYKRPNPNIFSFNTPIGACERCRGFGRIIDINLDLIIPDKRKSLKNGAIKPWGSYRDGKLEFYDLMEFCKTHRIPTTVPFERLKDKHKEMIINGTDDYYGIRGFLNWLETRKYKLHVRVFLSRYRSYVICPECNGTRLKKEALLYHINGMDISGFYSMSVNEAWEYLNGIEIPLHDKPSLLVLDELKERIRYLRDVGLGYLTLDRQSRTLSGGEVQRTALASALGSSLSNSLYILDEPSIGLHPRDTHRLIEILKSLRDMENTVVVVEHDRDIIAHSDLMLDLGPRAGDQGGKIMYFGPTPGENGSLTSQYITGKKHIPAPEKRRTPQKDRWLIVEGAEEHNLKKITVRIPLGLFVGISGVSGSGKSTLAEEIIYRAIKRIKGHGVELPGRFRAIKGYDLIDDVILVDQKPLGRTPRGNIMTYMKIMDPIRRLLADTPVASEKGLTPSHFSFNVSGGRCEACKGAGYEKVEMQFLSDVFITCPLCGGERFKKEILEVTFNGRNIGEIFRLTAREAIEVFKDYPRITEPLEYLCEMGLGYLTLGQPINTLSGGEAQRLRLIRLLQPESLLKTNLIILDEPTTGLHFEDIKRLIRMLQILVDKGNTLLVIEHNMDVLKSADWIIDLGPEGGEEGGYVVSEGPPEKVSESTDSYTGKFLSLALKGTPVQIPSSSKTKIRGEIKTEKDRGEAPITIKGAREHNLKELNVEIPKHKLVVITGVSGSGKSTLAYDIIFSEARRRYLESITPYVRQYVKVLERPDVDLIRGLPPAVAIQQRMGTLSAKSTVGTITEIYHFMRLLFSKLASGSCPQCGGMLKILTVDEIIGLIKRRFKNRPCLILAPKVAARKGFHRQILMRARWKGYKKARIDGTIMPVRDVPPLSRYQDHSIEIVAGELPAPHADEIIKTGLDEGNGRIIVLTEDGEETVFSIKGICANCGAGVKEMDPRLFSFNSRYGACPECEGFGVIKRASSQEPITCPSCGGSRLKAEALSIRLNGFNIWDLARMQADTLFDTLNKLDFREEYNPIVRPIMREILPRLRFMKELGLGYLSLDRAGNTLSGGETQRLRISAQLGSNLSGVLYILDEPTIGLHPRDNRRLIKALQRLRDRGNSLLVVEHDEDTILSADHVIDIGPGPGGKGGMVICTGPPSEILKDPSSVTGKAIRESSHRITSRLRPLNGNGQIEIKGATYHNLKGIDVKFPIGTLICVTGVSGSGKSSLLKDTLYHELKNLLSKKRNNTKRCKAVKGWEQIDRVLEVDHSPIGLTPRSVPASYVGLLTHIRNLLAGTPLSRSRGYGPGRFSFNVRGGRCEACKGQGSIRVEMSFLPEMYVHCEVCQGTRFNPETLDVQYRGKNIAEILNMTFDEALEFFGPIPYIKRGVNLICRVGLGYLKLGQPSPTLSGGEAQRIKLAKELIKPSSGKTLYILDEPTTGLHITDIRYLVDVLQELVDRGNTVAIIEHNLEIIKEADYLIDLGPESGDRGGYLIKTGSPVEFVKRPGRSHTAKSLKKYMNK